MEETAGGGDIGRPEGTTSHVLLMIYCAPLTIAAQRREDKQPSLSVHISADEPTRNTHCPMISWASTHNTLHLVS